MKYSINQQQVNLAPMLVATMAGLLVAIPLTMLLTIWLLSPDTANAAEFAEQNANTQPVTNNYYYKDGTSATGCSATGKDGGSGASAWSGSASPVAGWGSSVEQNQIETNTTTSSVDNSVYSTSSTSFALTDSFNITDSFTVRGDTYNDSMNTDIETDVEVDVDVDVNSNNEQSQVNSDDSVNNAPSAGDIEDAIIVTGALGL